MTVPAPILWICAFVAAAVFAVMIHSIATFRRSNAEPGARGRALVEILWAIVPIFIMVSTALPAVKMLASPHATQNIVAVQAHNDP
jgi:heme/copper-type cytochrome/quinol oxidase subunit 2